jgi:hypothetical protein
MSSEILIYQTEDGKTKIENRLEKSKVQNLHITFFRLSGKDL